MKITTNFEQDTFFVLTDTEERPIAVLNFPKGENVDVTEKIRAAILHEIDILEEEEINFHLLNTIELSPYCYAETISFSNLFEGEEEIEDWTLTRVTMY